MNAPVSAQLPTGKPGTSVWQTSRRGRQAVRGYWRRMGQSVHGCRNAAEFSAGDGDLSGAEAWAIRQFLLSEKETEALQRLAVSSQVDLTTVLVGTWALLLREYGPKEPVLFGISCVGRDDSDGYAAWLPYIAAPQKSQTIEKWLRQCYGTCRDLVAHSDCTRVEAAEWSGSPPSQLEADTVVVAGWERDSPRESVRLREGTDSYTIIQAAPRVWVTGDLVGGQLAIRLEFAITHCDEEVMKNVSEALHSTLTNLEQNRKLSVDHLRCMPDDEFERIVYRFNDTGTDFGPEACVHWLFENQVRQSGDRTAVVEGTSHITYATLNDRADYLAAILHARGVGPSHVVGIHLHRSIDMVAAMLGILKAGAAYVVFDPTLPHTRLAFMVKDTSTRVVITRESLMDNLRGLGPSCLCIDDETILARCSIPDAVDGGVQPKDVAYVVYTSGSTGRPKGVMVQHRGLWNRLMWNQEQYGIEQTDRLLHKSPVGVDASVIEFFRSLIAGSELYLAPPAAYTDVSHIDMVADLQLTVTGFRPSHLKMFLEENDQTVCPSLRDVICAGEALTPELVASFYDRFQVDLHNSYGPTEASVSATHYICKRGGDGAIVPIGTPISNMRIHILSSEGTVVPIGVKGEICIGGIGVALGYLNRPELTSQRFVPDPFSNEPDARLYKTGDIGRYRNDGNIEFLGREDTQVKIRGYRIELGEVEAEIRRHDNTEAAVVITRDDLLGGRCVVAYIVYRQEHGREEEDVREHLSRVLPEYMLPSVFVKLKALPLMASGKINRKALPKPRRAFLGSAEAYVPPRSRTEVTLASIWRHLLGVEQVGVHDDFFACGGDSLLCMDMVIMARESGCQISYAQAFKAPTISDLAQSVGAVQPRAIQGEVVGDVPLLPCQSRFLCERGGEPPSYWNLSAIYDLPIGTQVAHVERALIDILVHHDALRITFSQRNGTWEAFNRPFDGRIPLSVVDLSKLDKSSQMQVIKEENNATQESILTDGPDLVKAVVYPTRRGSAAPAECASPRFRRDLLEGVDQ